ncbi:MAG: hypothetical protein QOH42_1313 [Blastocatellia bacterium]|nr:hypothetical protein [Blastocatellia bacterium]
MSIAKRIVPQLIRDGEIRRPKLGIAPRDVASLGRQLNLPVAAGVLIVSVAPGSPAANAGLRGVIQTEDGDLEIGDIIVGIDGQKVDSNDDLFRILDKHKIGDSVSVEVFRQGHRTSVPVRLTEIPAQRRNSRE